MESNSYRLFVGVDLGSRLHQVHILDARGKYLGEGGFEHTAEGLAHMADWLLKRANGQPAAIAVAVEQPHGAVVDTLLERGIAVYAINPKQSDRFRDRHSPSGAKDDRRDAFVLADALRKDRHCFQLVRLPSPQVIALRERLRIDEELCKQQVAVSNRLHGQLLRCQPHLLELAPDKNLIDLFFWEVLQRFGSPEMARQADKQSIQTLLRHYRIRPPQSRPGASHLTPTGSAGRSWNHRGCHKPHRFDAAAASLGAPTASGQRKTNECPTRQALHFR